MAAAGVEGELDVFGGIVPIERVFHLIAVEIIFAVSFYNGWRYSDVLLAEDFLEE